MTREFVIKEHIFIYLNNVRCERAQLRKYFLESKQVGQQIGLNHAGKSMTLDVVDNYQLVTLKKWSNPHTESFQRFDLECVGEKNIDNSFET